ncbi:gamma adaptin ear containing, arf binding protein [Xenoophorus captivus]|uniref:Gamma adaptin ear containing, arf binding protein n=1 Tax=Xenoophorus captivus TaxID=1517983 RepID=A0ABV0R4G8_9TELE
MAAAPSDETSLQSLINKATNPLNKETDWDNIKGFCDKLDTEPDGPQLATRLLAHKIQSPQEWEAMQALLVLETCMKNCGNRFHGEVGKFRFLNELIKVVSPKDQKRVEKVSKRVNAIQEVKESVSLLSQLLEGYSKESCSHSNQELIKVCRA